MRKKLYIKSILIVCCATFTLPAQSNNELWKSAYSGTVGGIGYFEDYDANIKNEEGQTPLMVAVQNGYTEVVRSLQEATVDVHARDAKGKTAFDYIKVPTSREEEMYSRRMYGALRALEVYQIIKGKAKIVQYGYSNTTDRLKITLKGAECKDFAWPKNTQCVSLKPALKNKPSAETLFKAIKSKNNALFDTSLAKTKDLSIKNRSNYTPLWAAIHYKNFHALEKLLDAGANINEYDKNGLKSPLYWAAMTNNVDLLKILLKHGADVNSKDRFGSVALSTWAFKCNNFNAIKILLENGANPYQKVKRGGRVFDIKPTFCKDEDNILKMKLLMSDKSQFSE